MQAIYREDVRTVAGSFFTITIIEAAPSVGGYVGKTTGAKNMSFYSDKCAPEVVALPDMHSDHPEEAIEKCRRQIECFDGKIGSTRRMANAIPRTHRLDTDDKVI